MFKLLALSFVMVMSSGCTEIPLDDLRDDARDVIEDARTRAVELGELSAEEIGALWAVEYKTVEAATDDLAALDAQLNQLGQDRWECYHVSEEGERRVFYFKRRKSNAISYLTNLLKVGAITF